MLINKTLFVLDSMKLATVFVVVLMMVAVSSCSQSEADKEINTLRVGVLPDQRTENIESKYLYLLDHIKEHTGIESELLIPESYEQLLQWFNEKKVDMALFGGVTYVRAHLQSGAVPLVMRDVDGKFRSLVLVRSNNTAKSLQDLKGQSFAFGSRLSTSGYIMPQHFFKANNIIPAKFFSKIEFSGAHDRTAEWVRDGKVDAGVSNSAIVYEMYRSGRLKEDEVRVLWETPPFADYVWAVQKSMNRKNRTALRDVFLHMSYNEADRELLRLLGANYYVPTGHDNFALLEEVLLALDKKE